MYPRAPTNEEGELKEPATIFTPQGLRFLDALPAFVYSARPDGAVEYVNHRWREFTGYFTDDASLGWSWENVIHRADLERVKTLWLEALRSGNPMDVEARVRRADGEYRWFAFRNEALCDDAGRIVQWCGTAIDIEDRKRAEQERERSTQYLAEAQRLTCTGNWVWDPRTDQMVFFSEEVYRIYGLDPREPVPSIQRLLQAVHPDDRARIRSASLASADDDGERVVQYRLQHPGGEIRHVRSIRRSQVDQTGQVTAVIGTVVDVTAQVHAEAEQRRLQQLEAELAHLNRLSMLGELAASLAHEIKQPITAAVTFGGACLRWLDRQPPDVGKARACAAEIVEGSHRAAEIIDRVRSLYVRQDKPRREPVAINEVIREMLDILHEQAGRHRVSLRAELEPALPAVSADRVQQQQVLMNLMLNGIEAMQEEGGELRVSSQRTSAELLVGVRDSGVGLPAGQDERLFEAFFTTKPQGTGMGLAISRRIVEAHGGRLWPSRNPDRGAAFFFSLPAT
jgi:PAS domain S-box-containing protein